MSADEDISYNLISAVREGRLQIVEELISSHGLSYSAAWADGYMLLRDAVDYKHTEISKLLLTNGCKVNSVTGEFANTPLHFAARNGDIEIVEMLLDRGAHINDKNRCDSTPLHDAIQEENMEIAALLINRGADVNAKTQYGETPLHIAAEKGYFPIVEHLVKHGANINSEYISTCREGYIPLCLAVESGSERIVELLLCRGADVNAKEKFGVTSLHIGAEKGYLQKVKHLLKHGADVNAAYMSSYREGYTPLCLAAERGHRNIVELLLQHGANVDAEGKNGKTVLQCAVERRDPVIVQHILKHCPNVNNINNRNIINAAVRGYAERYNEIIVNLLQYGFTLNLEHENISDLLHAAVRNGQLKIVEELLKYSPDINKLNSLLYVAIENNNEHKNISDLLRISVIKGYLKLVEELLKYSPDINMINSLLYVAIENKKEDIGKLLIRNGASVNNAEKNKTLPLFAAVKYRCKEIVEVLLDHGADVHASDGYGRTALHYTTLASVWADGDLNDCGEIAKVLLNRGANVNAQCCAGLTALHMAVEGGYKNFVEVLLKHNADVNSTDKNHMTPLHFSYRCDGLIPAMLLEHGADINFINNFNETPLDLDMDDRVREILMHHIIKRKAANLYLTEKNLLSIDDNNSFQNECEKELAAMRSEKIGNSIISFYDILTKDISRLEIILQNENIVENLRSAEYNIKFPLYGSMIKNQFRKGKRRNELLKQVNKYCGIIFTQLPYCCTQTIIGYLSDADLRILASACEPANVDEVTPSRPKKRRM